MSSISSFQKTIDSELNALISLYSARNPKELYEPISYTLGLGGKRMRPALVLLACDLFNGKVQKAIPAALAIELFHNFTLIHDDIMDNAPLRRGQPTVFQKWGKNVAILSGDVLQVEAYSFINKCDERAQSHVLEIFNQTAIAVCEGQQLDMNFEKAFNVTINEYIKMIEMKTAVLLAASLKIGAVIAGASENDANALYEFGKCMGIAFQLQDDILDVYGNTQKFGKQKGGDIISNKKTYLLLKAMELSSNNKYRQEELIQWMHAPEFDPAHKVEAVTGVYDFLGVKKLAEAESMSYYQNAIHQLKTLKMDDSKKQVLQHFAESLLNREN